jgi:hypothetical protein
MRYETRWAPTRKVTYKSPVQRMRSSISSFWCFSFKAYDLQNTVVDIGAHIVTYKFGAHVYMQTFKTRENRCETKM